MSGPASHGQQAGITVIPHASTAGIPWVAYDWGTINVNPFLEEKCELPRGGTLDLGIRVLAHDGDALEAGCWGVGIARYSNYMGIDTLAEAESLPAAEIQKRLALSRNILRKAGSHYVIDTFDQLPGVIDNINQRLAEGQRP